MWRLAWRNIWRKRGRSAITAGAVALVVLMTTAYFGMVGSMENGIYTRLTQGVGHIQVHPANYRDYKEFSELLIYDAAQTKEKIRSSLAGKNSEIVAVLDTAGLLEGDGRSRGIILHGLEQPQSARERFIKEHLISGEFPNEGDLTQIALGENLAKAIKANIGDEVFMYAPGTEGYGAAAYIVSGILDLGEPTLEARTAYVSLAAAQELAAPDAVTRFEIGLNDIKLFKQDKDVAAVTANLQEQLGQNLEAETWRQVDPSLAAYIEMLSPATMIFTAIFFILAGLLVMNTVYLSLIERVREFGTIMALGASKRKVMGMVISESLLLSFSGAIIGTILGLAIVALMARGYTIPVPKEQYDLYNMPRILYGSIKLSQIMMTVIFTFIIGVFAAILPAMTASRLEPVEAMRFTA